MKRKIAVLGAGAIGSSVSADLTKAGYDITVIDQWPAQVEALKATGLHIQVADGDPFTKAGVFAAIAITRMRKGQWNPGAAEGA